MWYNFFLERDLIPDVLIRKKIKQLLHQRLREERKSSVAQQKIHLMKFIGELKSSAIAINTTAANDQHYEVPAEFYKYSLGSNLKYSCALWEPSTKDLDTAEKKMLDLTCSRAQLQDGQQILELGCGWGSLSLFMAEKYRRSFITAVSNSHSQKKYIDEQIRIRGLKNLKVITCDINNLDLQEKFDRVISVEMFEHMRNYEKLLKLISGFLRPEGLLFVHIFVHKEYSYPFEVKDESDWMSKYFFTGGIMPGDDLLSHFNSDLQITQQWKINGEHYGRTAEMWLRNMDKHKKEVMTLFVNTYGKGLAKKWWVYWRIFFMSCAELWSFNKGEEWYVSHYLLNKIKT